MDRPEAVNAVTGAVVLKGVGGAVGHPEAAAEMVTESGVDGERVRAAPVPRGGVPGREGADGTTLIAPLVDLVREDSCFLTTNN